MNSKLTNFAQKLLAFVGLSFPRHARWSLVTVVVLAAIACATLCGYAVWLVSRVAYGLVVAHWPLMVAYVCVGAVLGGWISHQKQRTIRHGIWAGIFYALLSLAVALLAFSARGLVVGFH
jgi:hypothetical protein